MRLSKTKGAVPVTEPEGNKYRLLGSKCRTRLLVRLRDIPRFSHITRDITQGQYYAIMKIMM
jgi:hypothetical protein